MEANTGDIRDRIKEVMNKVRKNSITFSEEIGIQQSTLSHILNGRNRPSLDVIMKINQRYPEISFDWLINGVGSMDADEHNVGTEQEIMNRSTGSFSGNNSIPGSGGTRSYMGTASPTATGTAPFVVGASKPREDMPDLFQQNSVENTSPISERMMRSQQQPDIPMPPKEVIKYVDKPCKKITEIIIYYDDNTWEKFTCEK